MIISENSIVFHGMAGKPAKQNEFMTKLAPEPYHCLELPKNTI
jgi:hypothetical protein